MPRRKGMIGPGAGAMGGPGMKPARPPTAAAGRPPPIKPPGASPLVGAPGPSPGMGMAGGGGGMGPPRGGGIGGAPGFKKGGELKGEMKGMKGDEGEAGEGKGKLREKIRYEKGGEVKGRVGRDTASAGKSC